jgi:YD repeat-containing protein
LEATQVKRLILDLLKNPSERDRQRKVGASNISQPCDYCLGMALSNGAFSENASNKWWLPARIGTAIHGALEDEEYKNIDRPTSYHFEALEGALIEQRITLGTIDGYGVIGSKPDLVLTSHNHLVDHKTTTKEKLKHYKLDGVPLAYLYQTQLYAWGLNKSGIKIEHISLNFICRDGSTDDDIWVYTFDYDESMAIKAWDRLDGIWKFITSNNTHKPKLELINELSSHKDCFKCSINGRF